MATSVTVAGLQRPIALLLAATVVTGCAVNEQTPRPSGSSNSTASGGPSETTAENPLVPAGLFTDAPAPHDLQPTLDSTAASSAVIDWGGGTIEATGPSGASYRLEIPPEAVAVATTITLTPLSAVTGFGLDPAPEHALGVELEPEGLQLLMPARLTMSAGDALPEAGVATGDYLGHGQDAGLVLADVTDSGASFEITHFSGYWSIWPLQMEDWRVFDNDRQAALERRLESMMAQFMQFRRSQEILGMDVAPLVDVVRNLMKAFDFEEQVLQNRLELSQNGCPEAQFAIAAFLTYDQQLQKLGIAEDELLYAEFQRPIPPELLILAWNVCLDEEYQRCAAIGEWPRLAIFLIQMARMRALREVPLTDAEVLDGQDRLKRCGHWRVKLNTSELYTIPGAGSEEQEWTSEIDVRWSPQDGPFGLVNSKIEGSADVVVNKLDWTFAASTETNVKTEEPAQARIDGLAFVTAPGGAEPVPVQLKLWVFPGSISFDSIIGSETTHHDSQYWKGAPILFGDLNYLSATIEKVWQFQAHPYKAVFAKDGSAPAEGPGGNRQVRIEVILEHTPG